MDIFAALCLVPVIGPVAFLAPRTWRETMLRLARFQRRAAAHDRPALHRRRIGVVLDHGGPVGVILTPTLRATSPQSQSRNQLLAEKAGFALGLRAENDRKSIISDYRPVALMNGTCSEKLMPRKCDPKRTDSDPSWQSENVTMPLIPVAPDPA